MTMVVPRRRSVIRKGGPHPTQPVRQTQREAAALVRANMGLVYMMVNRYSNHHHFDDLLQEATIGLWRAAQIYDTGRGLKFSTIAGWYIAGRISRYFKTRMKAERVEVSFAGLIDEPGGARAPAAIEVLVARTDIESETHERRQQQRQSADLWCAMLKLAPEDRWVLEQRATGKTLQEVGAAAGQILRGPVTRERVRQIEQRAMKRLRSLLKIRVDDDTRGVFSSLPLPRSFTRREATRILMAKMPEVQAYQIFKQAVQSGVVRATGARAPKTPGHVAWGTPELYEIAV